MQVIELLRSTCFIHRRNAWLNNLAGLTAKYGITTSACALGADTGY